MRRPRLCMQPTAQAREHVSVHVRAQNLCNLIWGMARLAEHPGPELMRRLLQKTEELLEASGHEDEDDVGQGIANTLWALAVLDELRPDFVERVSAAASAHAHAHLLVNSDHAALVLLSS